METQEFIPVDVFCIHHKVETAFVVSLQEFGLIEIANINEADCIPVHQLSELEKLVRLHEDLQINLEGIDAVAHLLQHIKEMNKEMQVLKNRLSLYEDV